MNILYKRLNSTSYKAQSYFTHECFEAESHVNIYTVESKERSHKAVSISNTSAVHENFHK